MPSDALEMALKPQVLWYIEIWVQEVYCYNPNMAKVEQ